MALLEWICYIDSSGSCSGSSSCSSSCSSSISSSSSSNRSGSDSGSCDTQANTIPWCPLDSYATCTNIVESEYNRKDEGSSIV